MEIKLDSDRRERAIESIKRYAAGQLDEEIGDLGAGMLLDYFLTEIGPSIYNKAIADAQANLHEQVSDLDGRCFAPEFAYWTKD